jgi:hypothetical protein
MKCAACSRKVVQGDNRYCHYHSQALAGLKQHYIAWTDAYGTISWNDFLCSLVPLNETGSWVKEVIAVEMDAGVGCTRTDKR